MKRGFSLVELSIVLAVLGLLVGGVIAAQSMMRASQLRSVITESTQYRTAVVTFQTQYNSIPGDFRYATRNWGRLNTNSDCLTNTSTAVGTPGVCDGNGDGTIGGAAAANQAGEMFQFWRHLNQAGMLDGTFSGLAGAAGGTDHIPGSNAPASRLKSSGWGVTFLNSAGTSNLYASNFGNLLTIGGVSAGNLPYTPMLLAEEAWNIDTKEDDGKPAFGSIRARDGTGFGGTGCTTSTSFSDYAGTYNTATNTSIKSCSLLFVDLF